MPLADLADAEVLAETAYYLDTSAVFALVIAAGTEGTKSARREAARALRVKGFVERVAQAGSVPTTTVLAMEELAAKARNTQRAKLAGARGFSSWSLFREADRAAANLADADAHSGMLEVMRVAAVELAELEVEYWRPTVEDGVAAARDLRKAHRELLRLHPSIDAMDALHIAVGLEMGVEHFIGFDQGWEAVARITVYR